MTGGKSNNPLQVENPLLNLTLGIILSIVTIWILIIGKTIIIPFMVALFLTFILDPVVTFLTRYKVPLGLSVFLTLVIFFIILYLLGMLIYANVQLFVKQFPQYQDRIFDTLKSFNHQLEVWIGR
ncbi:MAG TPA: AI-2E family transporter, partial [Caldithrix abyssi]|nr:AI-2E family transporter [Caldithrix abyssi]